MKSKKLIVFIILIYIETVSAQSYFSMNFGLCPGYTTQHITQTASERREAQFYFSTNVKSIRFELNYSVVPKSFFGIKNKGLVLTGLQTDINKRFMANIMLGLGYISSTKYRSYEDFEKTHRVYHPDRFNFCIKSGISYRIINESPLSLGVNFVFNPDRIYYANKGGIHEMNYNLSILMAINYVIIKNNK